MNELFEFRKHLNMKKFIIFAILIVIVLTIFLPKNTKKQIQKEEAANPYKTYYSINHKISLELPKRYNLIETQSEHTLQLQAEDGLIINIEENNIVVGKSLKEIATSDKNVYLKKFDNIYDISDLKEFNLENDNLLSSYKYNFKHTNQSTNYNITVFWIQSDTQYYIITVSIPENNISKYQGLEAEIVSSFNMN